MAVFRNLDDVVNWVQYRLRIVNPDDPDQDNPSSYVDIPVVAQITFANKDKKSPGVDTQHVFNFDLSDDLGHYYHIFRVCNVTSQDGELVYDEDNYVDVERVECYPIRSQKDNAQVTGMIMGNTDLDGGWPAQPGQLDPFGDTGLYRQVVRYTTDNTLDGVPWVDVELINLLRIKDKKSVSPLLDGWAQGTPQEKVFRIAWYAGLGPAINDPDDPYKPTFAPCDPNLMLLKDHPIWSFFGINDNSQQFVGEQRRFQATGYPKPTTFVSGGAEDDVPDDTSKWPGLPYRLDPLQNIVNVNWADCVEFEVDNLKPGKHSKVFGPDVALLKQANTAIPDVNRLTVSCWFQVPGDGGPPGSGESAAPYRLIEFGGSAPPPFQIETSKIEIVQGTADGSVVPTMFVNILLTGPRITSDWESELPNETPYPCKFADVPPDFYGSPTAQFTHTITLSVDTKIKWEDFKDKWHHLAFSVEANEDDLASTATKVEYTWVGIAWYSVTNDDFSGAFNFNLYNQFYQPPYLPCAVGSLNPFNDHFFENVTDMPNPVSAAWELASGNFFGPQPKGKVPSGYGSDGFPLAEGFIGQLRFFMWHNNVAGDTPAWYFGVFLAHPLMAADNTGFENTKFALRFDGKVIAKTGDPVGTLGTVPKVDLFPHPKSPLNAGELPPDDDGTLLVVKDTEIALPRETTQAAFDIPHRYAETAVWFQPTEYIDLTDETIYGYFAKNFTDPVTNLTYIKPAAFTAQEIADMAAQNLPPLFRLSPAAKRFPSPTLFFKGNKKKFIVNQGTGGDFVKVNTIEDFSPGPNKVKKLI